MQINWRVVFAGIGCGVLLVGAWSLRSDHRTSVVAVSPTPVVTATIPAPVTKAVTPVAKPASKRHRAVHAAAKRPPVLRPAPIERFYLVKCAGFHPFRELWALVRHYVARKPLAC